MNQTRLKKLLTYDQKTGVFRWRESPRPGWVGKVAGNVNGNGYRYIKINGVLHRASRLAFLYMTGHWPKDMVDHINRVRDDDRWSNLREATRGLNTANSKRRSDNTSGVSGVHPHQGKWEVMVGRKYIGMFASLQQAERAAKAARLEQYGI